MVEPGRRVAVLTGDVLGEQLAGAGIRAWNIAHHLAGDGHDVRLLSTAGADRPSATVGVETADPGRLREAVTWAEVVVAQGWVLARDRALLRTPAVVVVDLYDPMHLEQLEQGHEAGDEAGRWQAVRDVTGVLNEQLLRGDAFLCASSRQRDFWLGQLAALGRINPATYDADPTLGSFVRLVPFGVPDEPAVATGPGARGVVDGIGPDDPLLLWGGGIYNWFDPVTLLHAIDRLRGDLPDLRLLFLGTTHPNAAIGQMRAAREARTEAERLGLLGRHVFFNDGWVPYDRRQNYLLEADLGVSTHLDHVETRFSFRTRLLDCIWAGLPIVCTRGDALGDLVDERGLGATVGPADERALAAAIRGLLTDPARSSAARAALRVAADDLRWSRVLEPLLDLCRQPQRAPDLVDPAARRQLGPLVGLPRRSRLATNVAGAARALRDGGPPALAAKVRGRLRPPA